ncbi:tRNA uridine-5-carboxymethylaminomethyl(34) synthesis GTPase MnmE [Pseudooceanicola nitratireducens]|uniref:tRNA uridine-5-carboxymethylaminomethyl(34) synthesis GTPase MnmE n=1 Tax=Pseudooceanicola nitratireducens TaxID=517719 RepID=UPI001C97BC89|nr:tRNA uridine-5-carboxymethylaminomethyl(34) synthesis GTPase MnmE [Pseudooceanicola nitratireducens]MBY6167414.1 tRNA uridine-5-carboxymethylaminomethyl(34) synthesis GTPase MnmE [Pseudooceanicola nitratireducens]
MDTIFALATAPGKAGVAIVRLSGPSAWQAVATLCGSVPAPRVSGLRVLTGRDGVLDEALVLTFEEGASFTGEKVAEFQLHGSTAVVDAVLAELGVMEGLRSAEAGEFTRRALENGRLDLAQVEGLADLIDAETEAQRKQAQRVLSGELGDKAESWRRDLIRAAALIEATIDFADEEVPVDVSPEVIALLMRVRGDLEKEIKGVGIAERLRTGFEVAIVGAPNIGKSTLLNALAGRDAAITSDVAGTTRDVIEVRMDLQGLPVTMLDTAGLRETEDTVEAIGVERAKLRAQQADMRVFLVAEGEAPAFDPLDGDLVLVGKADLVGEAAGRVSGVSGFGVSELVSSVRDRLKMLAAGRGVATRDRHRSAMVVGLSDIDRALEKIGTGGEVAELAAEDLRACVRALDSLVGRVDVEMLLDDIFSSFCIGK